MIRPATPSGGPYDRYGDGRYLLSAMEIAEFWAAYAPDDRDHPLLTPFCADLAGLPPSLLVVAEHDVLADDSRRLHARMHAAGVTSTLNQYPGTVHSFLEAAAVAPVAEQALNDTARWIQDR
ncbi:MAG: alpha/beta hydrolase fold domain-containing protein [Abyssibacter sp.]|uniref:alpha/beta hydrolase fold domain-containing protein n=1 Tax=Abyssibacter sp. TaxID=2320200 RepID=UPI00321A7773